MSSLERGRVPTSKAPSVGETPLIDRAEEMNLLREAADRALGGEGGVVFLSGEAGIGKTRLTNELGAYARLRGMQVLHGRCPVLLRMDGVPPYVLWSEVIKDFLHSSSPDELYKVVGLYPAELFKLAPEIKQKFQFLPESPPISPEYGRDRLFEAVSQFVTNISKQAPLLIILDDLQWTDQTSLLLMHYLARGVYGQPLLLLGAYRDTDIDEKHPLTPVLTELNRERLLRSTQLKRMSFDETTEMIKQILEQDDVPKDFCQKVYEKTRGNPFFTEEVIKSLKEEGVITRSASKWEIKDVSEIEFPLTVKTVIKARVARLDEESQNILMLASFIGNDFTPEALSAVAGIEESRLLELLDKMFKTGLIEERVFHGEAVCSFADMLVRDVVYDEVSPLKRKKLHGTVGGALEKLYSKHIDEHLGELAMHFLESGNKDKALEYFLRAGDHAAKIYANDEAESFLQSALKLLDERDETGEKARVLERLGDLNGLLGDYNNCLMYWNDLLTLWRQKPNEATKQEIARVHRKMAHVLWDSVGDLQKATVHQNEALKALEAEPESAESARLYAEMARMYWRTGDAEKGRSWAEKAFELSKKLNEPEIMATSCLELAAAVGMMGERKKSLELYETALQIALDNNFFEIASRAYNNLPTDLLSNEAQRARESWEKAYELAKKHGFVYLMNWPASNLASNLANAGELDRAVRLSEEVVALDRKTGDLVHLTLSLSELGSEYRVLGEWEKSEKCLQEAFSIAQGLKDYQAVSGVYGSLANLYYDEGEYNKARNLLEKSAEFMKKTSDKMLQMSWSFWTIALSIELGDIEGLSKQMDSLFQSALEVEEKTGNKYPVTVVKMLRGMLLNAQGRWEEAIKNFDESRQGYEELDAKRWNVYEYARRVLFEYAKVYLARNRSGDKEKADNLLSQALEIFQKIGAKKDIEKTLRLLEGSKLTQVEAGETITGQAAYNEVQVVAIAVPKELKIGERLELEIELTNVRKEGVIRLIKVSRVIPENFAIVTKPETFRLEGDGLITREKRLEPSKTEVVKLTLAPKTQGTFEIAPKIIYIDENGKEESCAPKPVRIIVRELGLRGWLKGER